MTLLMPSQSPIAERFVDDGLQRESRGRRGTGRRRVTMAMAPASTTRSWMLFAEKPPNTTECVAPMRAHACIATTAWIDIGM